MDRPLAVVTGVSNEVGLELARQFAEHGYDLIISCNTDKLEEARHTLEKYGANVTAVRADLSIYKGVEALYKKIKSEQRPVDSLSINAEMILRGSFLKTSLDEEIKLINQNVISVIHLTKRLMRDMVNNGRGRVLISSTHYALMPGPFESVYVASKAFMSSFAESIRAEAKEFGVSVTLLLPGDTLLGSDQTSDNDPVDIAREGFEGLMSEKDRVVGYTFKSKIIGIADKLLPENWRARAHRLISGSDSARH